MTAIRDPAAAAATFMRPYPSSGLVSELNVRLALKAV